MMKRYRTLAMIGLMAFGLVAPIAGSVAATIEDIANLTGPERQKILEEGARQEGAVAMIGGLNQDMRVALFEAFMKKYPFIKAEGQRFGSAATLQRILA